jgi:nucleoside-diphosphate-sugar epimerase
MQVFVLGATGWIGGAITDALLAAHHKVIALARTAQAASTLRTKGATTVQGEQSRLWAGNHLHHPSMKICFTAPTRNRECQHRQLNSYEKLLLLS